METDSMIKCDFCSDEHPTWRYPTENFKWRYPVASDGDWAACDLCKALIEADDREGLAKRSVDTFVLKNPWANEAENTLHKELVSLHKKFFANRKGGCLPLDLSLNSVV